MNSFSTSRTWNSTLKVKSQPNSLRSMRAKPSRSARKPPRHRIQSQKRAGQTARFLSSAPHGQRGEQNRTGIPRRRPSPVLILRRGDHDHDQHQHQHPLAPQRTQPPGHRLHDRVPTSKPQQLTLLNYCSPPRRSRPRAGKAVTPSCGILKKNATRAARRGPRKKESHAAPP